MPEFERVTRRSHSVAAHRNPTGHGAHRGHRRFCVLPVLPHSQYARGVLHLTAAEPEPAGDEEELDVFQPRRSPFPKPGYGGLFEDPRAQRGGPTVLVRGPRISHARPRTRSQPPREPLKRLAARAPSSIPAGLTS